MYNIFTMKQAHVIYFMCKLSTEKYSLLNHDLTFHMEVFAPNFVQKVALLIEMKYIKIFLFMVHGFMAKSISKIPSLMRKHWFPISRLAGDIFSNLPSRQQNIFQLVGATLLANIEQKSLWFEVILQLSHSNATFPCCLDVEKRHTVETLYIGGDSPGGPILKGRK